MNASSLGKAVRLGLHLTLLSFCNLPESQRIGFNDLARNKTFSEEDVHGEMCPTLGARYTGSHSDAVLLGRMQCRILTHVHL